MCTFDVNCAPFTCDAHSDVASKIAAHSRWNIAQRRTGAVKTAVEGGPRALQGDEGAQINEGRLLLVGAAGHVEGATGTTDPR